MDKTINLFDNYSNILDKINCSDADSIIIPHDNLMCLVISNCNNLSYNWVVKHAEDLQLEYIIANSNIDYGAKLIDQFKKQLNFDKLAFILAYRVWGSNEPELNKNRLAVFKKIDEYDTEINWEIFDIERPYYEINEDFIKYFFNNIEWINLFTNYKQEFSSELLSFANKHNLINYKSLEKNKTLPQYFIENLIYGIYLQYVESKEPENVSYMDRGKLMDELRSNPELLLKFSDKSTYSFISKNLHAMNWIDRAGGEHQHYADDEIDWIDYGGEFTDDGPALQNDAYEPEDYNFNVFENSYGQEISYKAYEDYEIDEDDEYELE